MVAQTRSARRTLELRETHRGHGFNDSSWRSSMRRGRSRRRRNPPPACPRLLPRPDQLILGASVRRSSRSVWSGFRPDMSQGAWWPPVVGPSFNRLLPKQFLVHTRDHALCAGYAWRPFLRPKEKKRPQRRGGELRPPCLPCMPGAARHGSDLALQPVRHH
jgi:hypothetical protein